MKQLFQGLLLLLIAGSVYSQPCFNTPGNANFANDNACLASGTYNTVTWNAILTIPAGENVTITDPRMNTGSAGSIPCRIVVEEGATLHITNNFSMSGSAIISGAITVDGTFWVQTGYLIVQASGVVTANALEIKGPNNAIAGKVTVNTETSIRELIGSTALAFTGCGSLITDELDNGKANVVSGAGFIRIINLYGGDPVNSPPPLTASTQTVVEYLGSQSARDFGQATLGSYSTCIALPVKYKKKSFKVVKITKL